MSDKEMYCQAADGAGAMAFAPEEIENVRMTFNEDAVLLVNDKDHEAIIYHGWMDDFEEVDYHEAVIKYGDRLR